MALLGDSGGGGGGSGGGSFSVTLPARTLCAVPPPQGGAAAAASQWLVGTTALREDNEVRVLEYDATQDRLSTAAVWAHPAEVWDAACCPQQQQQPGAEHIKLATLHSRAGVSGATIWQADAGSQQLAPLAQLPHNGIVRRVLWSGLDPATVLTVEEGALRLWDVGGGAAAAAGCGSLPSHGDDHHQQQQQQQGFWTAALHPRDPTLALAAAGSRVQLWDVPAMAPRASVPGGGAAGLRVRDVSWAPHNPHRFVSAGDDGKLRFWDTRMLAQPEALLELAGHSHWVWRAAYSPCHDQLLLTSSSDTTVALWFMPQLAKHKGLAEAQQAAGRQAAAAAAGLRPEAADGKAHTCDDHDDSVYGLAWSGADPWLFASLSYDGRVLVSRVPKSVKYKVLI